MDLICKGCGASYEDDKVLCPYCGHVNDKNLAQSNTLKMYDKKIDSPKQSIAVNPLPVQPSCHQAVPKQNVSLKKLTIIVCTALSIIMVFSLCYTYYYANREAWQRKRQVSGSLYTDNLAQLNAYIQNKEYMRALTLARATCPDEYDFSSYPDVSEELNMIADYSSFLSDARSYFLYEESTEDVYISNYIFDPAKEVYDARANSDQAKAVKADLCDKLDLYLKNFYQLTDDEIEALKSARSIEDFMIEGQTDYDSIIEERMSHYEQNN